MDQLTEDVLVRVGLTKNESKVYVALLKLGKATVVEITKKSGVHRVNVYDVLDRLMEKGLISTILRSKKRIYEAANPNQLSKLLKEKEAVLNQILPSLEKEFDIKKEKQNVYHFFGPEGIMQSYYMMLGQKQTLYAIGGSGLNRKYLKHRHEMFQKDRVKAGVLAKGIYYESTRGSKEKSWVNDPTIEVKFIPDEYKTSCMVDICGDLVVNLLPIEDNIMAIVIENKSLADTYRQFFQYMWDNAKP